MRSSNFKVLGSNQYCEIFSSFVCVKERQRLNCQCNFDDTFFRLTAYKQLIAQPIKNFLIKKKQNLFTKMKLAIVIMVFLYWGKKEEGLKRHQNTY